ncbi:hypothetical protein BD410DRAFT_789231 [Rickenella mellea]|uniref:F-box domain-containing protein n=1 Tax=Rickenella mellea TaxID=50990 RepID=A0A4Y7Q3E7_9AGAM|nr:hypothetical protein BD410DRAFT_789231 [Rickenella mellea]
MMERVQYKPDILMEIFLYSSPWDLLQLYATCRSFNIVLHENQHIWRLARKRLAPPVPDPTLPANLFGFPHSWTEVAYAKYIFGNTKCTFCGDVIDEPFVFASFSLKLFPCTKRKKCSLQLYRETRSLSEYQADGFKIENMQFCQSYMPYLEFSGDRGRERRRYAASQFKIAKAEWQVARELFHGVKRSSNEPEMDQLLLHISIRHSWSGAYMTTAESLVKWQSAYLRLLKTSNIVKRNIVKAQHFANDDRMKFSMVERSSTFKSYILSLNRTQTLLTLSDWRLISRQIHRDMQDENYGIMKFPIAKDWKKPVVCPLCPTVRRPRLFEGSGCLLDHAMRKHRGIDRSTLVKDAK